ncbi:MAG: tetratricopeptide repeat protein, partial [Alkalispirochaeta sp.]
RIKEAEDMIRLGRFTDAISLLTEILADDPEDLPALLNVGIAFTESGENDKAIRTLNYYVTRDDRNPEAWEALGCAHLRKHEYDEAEEYLNRARIFAPENASILRNMSVLLSRTGRGRESLSLLKRAHELDPNDYLAAFALGQVYHGSGEAEKAQELFDGLLERERLPEVIRREAEKHALQLSVGW